MNNVPDWMAVDVRVRMKKSEKRETDPARFALDAVVTAIEKDELLTQLNGKVDMYRVRITWSNGETDSFLPVLLEKVGN
tara:strand:+ start:573 stop:809 length:237 start_codon:yes stop_codon:yes gene_type:complete